MLGNADFSAHRVSYVGCASVVFDPIPLDAVREPRICSQPGGYVCTSLSHTWRRQTRRVWCCKRQRSFFISRTAVSTVAAKKDVGIKQVASKNSALIADQSEEVEEAPPASLLPLLLLQAMPFAGDVTAFPYMNAYFLATAVCAVYTGAHMPRVTAHEARDLSFANAALFPVFASGSLLAFYWAIKNGISLEGVITAYVVLVGSIAAADSLFEPALRVVLPKRLAESKPFAIPKLLQPITERFGVGVEPLSVSQVGGAVLSVATVLAYAATRSWATNNLIALAIVVQIMQLIRFQSIPVALALLAGVFFYDAYWVFGSDVMATVATSLDVPAKIVFPHADASASLLGLGDIVLPGLFAAQLLLFDRRNQQPTAASSNPDPHDAEQWRDKPYFTAALASYALGLVAAIFCNNYFDAPQPALVYIVPSLLIAVGGTAVFRREVTDLWSHRPPPPPSKDSLQ